MFRETCRCEMDFAAQEISVSLLHQEGIWASELPGHAGIISKERLRVFLSIFSKWKRLRSSPSFPSSNYIVIIL